MNFRYRLMQFMSGRYGQDELGYCLFVVALIISVLNIFLRLYILQIVVYTLIIYTLFRIFSRNHEARRRENRWFRENYGKIKKQIEFIRERKADKFHIYRKCPVCKAVLRLPHRIGVHKTVCPRCGKEFTVKVKK